MEFVKCMGGNYNCQEQVPASDGICERCYYELHPEMREVDSE